MQSLLLTAPLRPYRKLGFSSRFKPKKRSRGCEAADASPRERRGAALRALGVFDIPLCPYIVVPSEHRAYVVDLVAFIVSQSIAMDAAAAALRLVGFKTIRSTCGATMRGLDNMDGCRSDDSHRRRRFLAQAKIKRGRETEKTNSIGGAVSKMVENIRNQKGEPLATCLNKRATSRGRAVSKMVENVQDQEREPLAR